VTTVTIRQEGDTSLGPRACPICGSIGTGRYVPEHIKEEHSAVPTGARRDGEPDLMTATMAAAMFGKRPTNMYGKNRPRDMPEPYLSLPGVKLYRRTDIEAVIYERAQAGETA
jgi:hypothetical protein